MIVGLSQRAGRPFTRRWLRLAGPPHTTQIAWSLSTISRSEEHTSELQSPCNLVCRLLLEKKKSVHLPLVVALHPSFPLHDHVVHHGLPVDHLAPLGAASGPDARAPPDVCALLLHDV